MDFNLSLVLSDLVLIRVFCTVNSWDSAPYELDDYSNW
jgi:hypothetical protein